MIYSKHQNLADAVVDYLTYHPGSSLSAMRVGVEATIGRASFQAWYKALGRLLDDGVIVKIKKRYSLSATWASKVMRLGFFIRSNYLSKEARHPIDLPTVAGEKTAYRFPDLVTMDTFWGHLAISLIVRNPGKAFYFYNPHTWFFVAHEFESKAYFESMQMYKVKNYTVVGGKTPIDEWSAKFHPKAISQYYCSAKSLFDHRLYITAIGDYYIEVTIEEGMARKIDLLFRAAIFDPRKERPPKGIENLFEHKSPCKMVVYLNPIKAAQFSRRIHRFF